MQKILQNRRALIGYRAFSVSQRVVRPQTEEEQMRAIFAADSTPSLCKKLVIYKMMSSNLFINHALQGMTLAYRLLGRTLTNFLINSTAGKVFTSGETL